MQKGIDYKKKGEEFITQIRSKVYHKTLNKTIVVFVVVLAILFGIKLAHEYNFFSLHPNLIKFLGIGITIIISYAIATLVVRLTINRIIGLVDESAELEQKLLLSKLYLILVYTLATLVVLWEIGITLQNITIFLGLLATGIALALRDIIASYFIWFILLTKKPFKIGDYIKVGNEEGIVQHIGTFYVVLDEFPENKDDFSKIPNKLFMEQPIRNFGRDRIYNTAEIIITNIPENLDNKLDKVNKEIEKMTGTKALTTIDSNKENIIINVYYSSSPKDVKTTKDKVLRIILKEFKDNVKRV
jgi:MscS family membrane protein